MTQHRFFFERQEGSPVHVDGAHLTVEWSDSGAVDLERPITFTVPIMCHSPPTPSPPPSRCGDTDSASDTDGDTDGLGGDGVGGMGGVAGVEDISVEGGNAVDAVDGVEAADAKGGKDGSSPPIESPSIEGPPIEGSTEVGTAKVGTTESAVLPENIGMKLWHVHRNDIVDIEDAQEVTRALTTAQTFHHEYVLGQMAFHTGQHYHQAKGFPMQQRATRLTLQGHGVFDRSAGVWQLFW